MKNTPLQELFKMVDNLTPLQIIVGLILSVSLCILLAKIFPAEKPDIMGNYEDDYE